MNNNDLDRPEQPDQPSAWPEQPASNTSTPSPLADSRPQSNEPFDTSSPDDSGVAAVTVEAEPATVPFASSAQPESPTAEPLQPTAAADSAVPSVSPPFGGTNSTVVASGPASVSGGKGKSKKPLIIGLVAAFVVLLGGGSVAAYNLWYQNPEKVVTDSALNLLRANSASLKGTAAMSDKDFSVSAAIDGRANADGSASDATVTLKFKSDIFAGKTFKINASTVVMKNGDLYAKVGNIKPLYDDFVNQYVDSIVSDYGFGTSPTQIAAMKAQMNAMFAPLVNKIDGQWIEISADDTKQFDESYGKSQQCISDTMKKLDNRSISREVSNAYRQHEFIVIKQRLGSRDGSLGYVLGYNASAAKQFAKALKKTQFGKDLIKCDSSLADIDTDLGDLTGLKGSRFEVWVDRWSHQLTRLSYKGASTGDDPTTIQANFTTTTNQPETVAVPKNAESLKDFESDLQSIFGSTL